MQFCVKELEFNDQINLWAPSSSWVAQGVERPDWLKK